MARSTTWVRLAAVVAVGALSLAACSNGGDGPGGSEDDPAGVTPAKGGTLRLADEGEAITLNPFTALDNLSGHVLAQIFEPLFRTMGDGKVVPWLAESSQPNADFTTWTIEIKEGVLFSDGTPMTADDVVFSLDAVRNADTWKAMYAEIETVEASSPSTVIVTTSVPSPALETSLSLPFAGIAPKDLAGMTPEEFGNDPIGTGPFKLESWERGSRLTLVRNENYWDPDRPFLDEVVFENVASDSSRAQQLRGGDLDLVASPPRPQLEALDQAPGIMVGDFALAYPNYLLLNQKSDIFSDPRMREAVDLAVDREAILEAAASGVGELGGPFIAPSLQYFDESITPVTRDTERAAALVAEAVADGVDPTFSLKIGAGNSYENLAAQIMKENFEDVGFSLEIEQFDNSAHIAEVAGGDYTASMFSMTSDIVDPLEVIGFYLDLDALWTGGETTRIRELFDAAKQEEDEGRRRDLYHRIQQIVYDDRSLVTLGYTPWLWAMTDTLVGFDLPPTGVPWLGDAGFRAE